MLKNNEYRLLSGLGILALVLVGVNIGLYFSNRSLTASVNARAAYIQQSIQIGNFRTGLAKDLAELVVKNHDDQLRAMLSGEGFTINQAPAAGTADAPKRGK